MHEMLIMKLMEVKDIAKQLNIGSDFEARLDDLIFEAQREKATAALEKEWEPIFKQSVNKPEIALVFGFDDLESTAPDRIIAESAETGFYHERKFEPDITDMAKLVHAFAEECAAAVG